MEFQQVEVPQQVPFRCPVCNGFGTLKYGTKRCQGCDGRGWVVVEQKTERERDQHENK